MATSKSKIVAQCVAGMVGGTILGIVGFLIMMGYGGNYGCWPLIDSIFGSAGYESCGALGRTAGIILGSMLGIIIISKIKIINYAKVARWLAIAGFALPYLFGMIIFWPPFESGNFFIVLFTVLLFMALSLIPSILITGALHWHTMSKKGKHFLIAFLALIIVLSTLLVPKTVYNKKDMEAVKLGYPITFVTGNFTRFDPPFPHQFSIRDSYENPFTVSWPNFLLSYVIIFVILELLIGGIERFILSRKKEVTRN